MMCGFAVFKALDGDGVRRYPFSLLSFECDFQALDGRLEEEDNQISL